MVAALCSLNFGKFPGSFLPHIDFFKCLCKYFVNIVLVSRSFKFVFTLWMSDLPKRGGGEDVPRAQSSPPLFWQSHPIDFYPKYLDSKSKFTAEDLAPYIVHVNKIVSVPFLWHTLRPIQFRYYLLRNNTKNVTNDGVKRVGRNRISIGFKSYSGANVFLDLPS